MDVVSTVISIINGRMSDVILLSTHIQMVPTSSPTHHALHAHNHVSLYTLFWYSFPSSSHITLYCWFTSVCFYRFTSLHVCLLDIVLATTSIPLHSNHYKYKDYFSRFNFLTVHYCVKRVKGRSSYVNNQAVFNWNEAFREELHIFHFFNI